MSRSLHKDWHNGRGGKWTCRMKWYEEGEGDNIRLYFETEVGSWNTYPQSVEQAQQWWDAFKAANGQVPFGTWGRN